MPMSTYNLALQNRSYLAHRNTAFCAIIHEMGGHLREKGGGWETTVSFDVALIFAYYNYNASCS